MQTILKWFKWLLGGGLIVVLVCYVALLVVNWNDEPASAAAKQLAEDARLGPAVPLEQNGFVYAMGFEVERGKDPRMAGAERIARFEQYMTARATNRNAARPDDPGFHAYSSGKQVHDKLADLCGEPTAECCQLLDAKAQALDAWWTGEQWLAERYRVLLGHGKWQEAMTPDVTTPFPRYADMIRGQKLLLLHVYRQTAQGHYAEVAPLLEQDIRFWRMVLKDSRMLVGKMLAASRIRGNLVWTNAILGRLPVAEQANALSATVQQPFSRAETSLTLAVATEWAVIDRSIKDVHGSGNYAEVTGPTSGASWLDGTVSLLSRPFLQPQATSNVHAMLFTRLVEISELPDVQFAAAHEHIDDDVHKPTTRHEPFVHLYNPIGDVLLNIAVPDVSQYAARARDLEGLRRAVVLLHTLRRAGVTGDALATRVAASPAGLHDPYTGQPFPVEPGKVVVPGLSRRNGTPARYELAL